MHPEIAILVFPETSASVVYGMTDLIASAGRDWGMIVEGAPGPQLLNTLLVAREAGTVVAANDVPIAVGTRLADCPPVEVICVPEVNLPPGTPLTERFASEIAWLRERYEAGATLATACSGAMLLAEAGLLTDCEATTHWAWCDVLERDYPGVKVQGQRAGRGRRGRSADHGGWWHHLA